MNIDHISVSRSSTWHECQQKYKYRYHLKVEPDVPEQPYFLYGKIVHKIAEEYVRSKGELTLGGLARDVLSGTIPIDGKANPITLLPEYKQKLPIHLRAVQSITEKLGFDGEIEYYFEYDLEPPNKKMIVGFIDRLITQGDHAWILDYKTTKPSKWRKDFTNITKDVQLRVYAGVVQRNFGIPPENIHTALYYVEDQKLVGAKFTGSTIQQTADFLLNVYNRIHNADPDHVQPSPGRHCERCDYRIRCPYKELTIIR